MTNTVTFVESNDGIATFEIERPLARGSMEPLWGTLFHLRVQIVSVDVRVVGMHLRVRVRVCEFDGAPLSIGRSREVTEAIDGELVGPSALPRLRRTTGHRLSL